MFLATDVLVVGLRALTFVALFQAVGTAIFLALFEDDVTPSSAERVRLWARIAAMTALVVTVFYYVLTPARMAGNLGSTFDPSLESLLLESSSGTANIVRVVGLALLALSLDRRTRLNTIAANIGAALAMASFAFGGHTAVHPLRWALAPLLLVHLGAAAFWYGALWPLFMVANAEPGERSSALIEKFSRLATRLVPGILLSGLIMGLVFVRSLAELGTPYGGLLIGKTTVFALLLWLAALNKWRFAPRIMMAERGAVTAFRRTVAAEWGLIATVLLATAVMTSLYAPEHLEGAFGSGHNAEH